MGAKGHRWYDWAFLRLDDGEASPGGQAGQHWLLVRRNQRTGELAFYRCYAPRPVPLARLVGVAGQRWTIEERFQTGKGLVGLDHSTRSAAGAPGTAGPPWPCSPTPSWSSRPSSNAPATRHRPGWSQ
jgi:alkylation response protein AidB-like acyl-CoA dehydrogenase